MQPKNSLDKILNNHKIYGNLKEDRILTLKDYDEIYNNVNLYLDDIKNNKYKYTLDELCNILEITKAYANTYFVNKLDTIYITRSCKLLMYILRSNDTNQIKNFIALFNKDDRKILALMLLNPDYNKNPYQKKFEELNLDGKRLLKKYFISESSIKRAIQEVFKKEIRTRILFEDEKIIQTEYRDIDDALADEILQKGLISTNTLKSKLNLKTDTQFHRVLKNFEELENLRLAVVNENNNKYNTIRYINDKDIIEKINRILIIEKETNEEYAQERYKREKFL